MAELRFTLPCRILEEPKSICSRFRIQLIYLFSVLVCLLAIFPFSGSEQVAGLECGSFSSKLLIKGGTVVNAHHQELADVYVEDGIIVSVQPKINVGDDVKVIDATGKYVMPDDAGYTVAVYREVPYGVTYPDDGWAAAEEPHDILCVCDKCACSAP